MANVGSRIVESAKLAYGHRPAVDYSGYINGIMNVA